MNKLRVPLVKVLIILGNAAIHKSKQMKKLYIEEGLRVLFLPAYSPELAPIEKFFSRIKRYVLKEASGKLLNWRSDSAMKILNRVIMRTTRENIIRYWSTFTKEVDN